MRWLDDSFLLRGSLVFQLGQPFVVVIISIVQLPNSLAYTCKPIMRFITEFTHFCP